MNDSKDFEMTIISNNKKPYRPTSYSEGYITLPSKESVQIPTIQTSPLPSPKIETLDNKNKCDKIKHMIFKRLLMFMIHVALIAVFEIFFFFKVIVNYEDLALHNLIDNYINPIVGYCPNLTPNEKSIYTFVYNIFFNTTIINQNAAQSLIERTLINDKIIQLAWIYFGVLVIFNLILIGINYFKKKRINLIYVLLDNFFMIVLLGLYEYLFFETIILKYQNIDTNGLTLYIANKLSQCSN